MSKHKQTDKTDCFFVSDIHGHEKQYKTLFVQIAAEKPKIVFMGGDLFTSSLNSASSLTEDTFISDFFLPEVTKLKKKLTIDFPALILIMGNDDPIVVEERLNQGEKDGLWIYLNNRIIKYGDFYIYGYPYVPPTPFLVKDWEKYDVSRFVDPGSVSPEEGFRALNVPKNEIQYGSIKKDFNEKINNRIDTQKLICLFHSPPYKCNLDRAALDGKMIDHVPFDVHVGSIAIREFFEERKPYVGLHGHIHESARITGTWKDMIGATPVFSAAHDGDELALVRFELENPTTASRELL